MKPVIRQGEAMRKKLIYMLLMAVLILGLSACGGSTDGTDTAGTETAETDAAETGSVEGHFTIEEYMRGSRDGEMRAIYKVTNECGFDIYSLHGDVDFTLRDSDEICEGAMGYTGCLSDGQTAYLTANTWDVDPENVDSISLTALYFFDGNRDYVYDPETGKTAAGDGNYALDTSGDFDTANSLTFSLTKNDVNSEDELVYTAEITNNSGGTVESVDYYIDGLDGEGTIVNVGGGYVGDGALSVG